jgi:hypothetical protein
MKQLLQKLKSGKTELVGESRPHLRDGHLLVRTSAFLISAGTERMLLEFGKAGYIAKAKSQPDKVKHEKRLEAESSKIKAHGERHLAQRPYDNMKDKG